MIERALLIIAVLALADGLIEGAVVNLRTEGGKPAFSRSTHLWLWFGRAVVCGFVAGILSGIIGVGFWQGLSGAVMLGGIWGPLHRLSMNIIRGLAYPIKWYHLSSEGYDGWWMRRMKTMRAAFIAVCLAELTISLGAFLLLNIRP